MKKVTIILLLVAGALISSHYPSNNLPLKADYQRIDGLSITSGASIVTTSSDVFSSSDVGKTIIVHGAGRGTDGKVGDELVSTIIAYNSSTSVTIDSTASRTVTSVSGGKGTDNDPILEALLIDNAEVDFQAGKHYFFRRSVSIANKKNIKISGNGANFYFISSNPGSYTGTQPVKSLFLVTGDSSIVFDNFKAYNIGQTIARADTLDEGGYYSYLNNTAVTYNRRFNKQANTGPVVRASNCQSIRMTNISSYQTGSLLIFISGGTSNGGEVTGCNVYGWGFSAITPAGDMVISNNYFNNAASPVLDSEDGSSLYGSAHVIYYNSGLGPGIIANNRFEYCRTTAIQWNTSTGAASDGNVVSGNAFYECSRAGSIVGNNNPMQITFSGNSYYNTGEWEIDQPLADLIFEGERWQGDYSGNDDFVGSYNISRFKNIKITASKYLDITDSGNDAVVSFLAHNSNDGILTINNCDFDSSCYRAFRTITDQSDFTGKCVVSGCNFGAGVSLGHQVADSVTSDGKNRFFFKDNFFYGKGEPQLQTKFGVTCIGNTHVLSSSNYALHFDVLTNGGESDVINCTFLNQGGGNAINLTASCIDNIIGLFGNVFNGAATLTTNGKTWRVKSGNFFEDTNTFDTLPL